MQKRINSYYSVLGGFPAIFILLFFSFVLRARFYLGYWPKYNKPDPQHLEFSLHWQLVAWFGILSLITCVIWIISIIIQKCFFRNTMLNSKIYLISLNWLIMAILIYFDFGGFLEWFID